MIQSKVIAIAVMLAFSVGPVMAQSSHTYQGGPKSDLPSHGIQPSATSDTLNMDMSKPPKAKANEVRHIHKGHTYQGGPKTVVPHSN